MNVRAKLAARRAAAMAPRKPASGSESPPEDPVTSAPAVCELCESDWGALSSNDIAELMIQAGRFREDERDWLLAFDRGGLVELFCGCSLKPRSATPAGPARGMGRR